MEYNGLSRRVQKSLLQRRIAYRSAGNLHLLPDHCGNHRSDALPNKDDIFVSLPVHIRQLLPGLFQGQKGSCPFLFVIAHDPAGQVMIGDPDDLVSMCRCQLSRVIQQGLITVIADPREQDRQFSSGYSRLCIFRILYFVSHIPLHSLSALSLLLCPGCSARIRVTAPVCH